MTSKDKINLLAMGLAFVLAVMAGSIVKESLAAHEKGANLASVSAARPTSFVKVRFEKKRVYLEALQADEKQVDPVTCQPENQIERYYGSLAGYRENLENQAICMTGYMKATILDGKIANAESSLETVTHLLNLLNKTKVKWDNLQTIDELGIGGIPVGMFVDTALENARNISIKCLEQNGVSTENSVAIGKNSFESNSIFMRANQIAKESALETEKAILEIDVRVHEEIAKEGKIGTLTTISLLKQVMDMESKFGDDFLPIDGEVLMEEQDSEHYRRDLSLSVVFSLTKTHDGKPIDIGDNIPWLIKRTLSAFKIKGPFLVSNIYIVTPNSESDFTTIGLPEQYILEKLKRKLPKKIAEFESIKKKIENNLGNLRQELSILESNNFGCVSGEK